MSKICFNSVLKLKKKICIYSDRLGFVKYILNKTKKNVFDVSKFIINGNYVKKSLNRNDLNPNNNLLANYLE